ncbi:glycosyltransferase family A protein [Nocardioides gilvus]|uniref:glycosyltransferase family A protein n=1 Tax=Nocardioides gilvus TaxID=1735589 RepID=UPI000D7428F5|nr:glycosyltransferase family 2 protein [Nocardioides gilvus]
MIGPVVRRNDWTTLEVPELGAWTPTRSMSVVMPAWGSTPLDAVLAALTAQTYPEHLFEVVVVDDGNSPPVELPDLRPAHTRLVRVTEGWGRANASEVGTAQSDGDIVMWLDADMLAFAEHLEAHARWHHVIDHAVVLGDKRFVTPRIDLTPAQVRDRVADGSIVDLHDWNTADQHTWIEEIFAKTDDLARAGHNAFHCLVGATVSMTRAMHDATGGLDPTLRLGEDTVFGHLLNEAGAVLLPDRGARAWHLGLTHVMQQGDLVKAYNAPAFADFVPASRGRRQHGRIYQVPYVEVVVPVDAGADRVQRCVDALLESDMDDLRVVLVADWAVLDTARVSPLRDPLRDLGILSRAYRHEPRVELVQPDAEVLTQRCRSPFRMTLASTALAPLEMSIGVLLADMERTHFGLAVLHGPAGEVVRVVRTAARSRAGWHEVTDPGEVDDFIADVFGRRDAGAAELGWVPWEERTIRRYRRPKFGAVSSEESWARVEETMVPALERRAARAQRARKG